MKTGDDLTVCSLLERGDKQTKFEYISLAVDRIIFVCVVAVESITFLA